MRDRSGKYHLPFLTGHAWHATFPSPASTAERSSHEQAKGSNRKPQRNHRAFCEAQLRESASPNDSQRTNSASRQGKEIREATVVIA